MWRGVPSTLASRACRSPPVARANVRASRAVWATQRAACANNYEPTLEIRSPETPVSTAPETESISSANNSSAANLHHLSLHSVHSAYHNVQHSSPTADLAGCVAVLVFLSVSFKDPTSAIIIAPNAELSARTSIMLIPTPVKPAARQQSDPLGYAIVALSSRCACVSVACVQTQRVCTAPECAYT